MSSRARELAAIFDRSFAEPVTLERARGALALAIVANGAAYLLPLAEVSLVARAPKIVPLPNGRTNQLGIAGLRGNLVTVFSLAGLLGESTPTKAEWLAVVRGVALAFDAIDGQVELTGPKPNLLDVDGLLGLVAGVTT